jgi:hypothetical protein
VLRSYRDKIKETDKDQKLGEAPAKEILQRLIDEAKAMGLAICYIQEGATGSTGRVHCSSETRVEGCGPG